MDDHWSSHYKSIQFLLLVSIEEKQYNILRDVLVTSPLRDQFINPTKRDYYLDPLCYAIEKNDIYVVQLFLDLGATIDKYDYTFVAHIICQNRVDILKLFVTLGLELNEQTNVSDFTNMLTTYAAAYTRSSLASKCNNMQELLQFRDSYLNKYSNGLTKCLIYVALSCYINRFDVFFNFFIDHLGIEQVKYDILFWCVLSNQSNILKYMLRHYTYEEECLRGLMNLTCTRDLLIGARILFKYLGYIDSDTTMLSYFLGKGYKKGVELCIVHNIYTYAQQSIMIKSWITKDLSYIDETFGLEMIKLLTYGGFELNEIADDLIFSCYIRKYFVIINYLKETKVDIKGALERIFEKMSKTIL